MSARFRTPALDAWRAELRGGKRTVATSDPLWRAACAEANALEFADIPALAARFCEDAKRIVREALKAQRREQGAA